MSVQRLPPGVVVRPLTPHPDARGWLTEIHRDSWSGGFDTVQWNMVRSAAGTLRGLHVHVNRAEVYIVVEGRAVMAVRDLRPGAETATAMVELEAERPCAVQIPPGVLHGTYFREDAFLAIGFSDYWSSADELGCRWDDPAAGVAWPAKKALISARDAALPSYAELSASIGKLRQNGGLG